MIYILENESLRVKVSSLGAELQSIRRVDTDIEYLSTGRRSFSRRPPVVISDVKVVEKIVEKPVVQVKTVEKIIEKPVIEYIEKPVVKHVYRTRYRSNTSEQIVIGIIAFLLGLLIGILIF